MKRGRRSAYRVKRKFWVCARTKGKQEYFAAEQIANQGYASFVPEAFDVVRQRLTPLLPGFVFMQTEGTWAFLLNTKGIYDVIRTGDKPSRMTNEQMKEFRNAVRDDQVVIEAYVFKRNDAVTISAGAWAGFEAKYMRDDGDHMALVEISVFGKPVVMPIMRSWLETAQRDAHVRAYIENRRRGRGRQR